MCSKLAGGSGKRTGPKGRHRAPRPPNCLLAQCPPATAQARPSKLRSAGRLVSHTLIVQGEHAAVAPVGSRYGYGSGGAGWSLLRSH
jgi:hypothetical protein